MTPVSVSFKQKAYDSSFFGNTN